MNPEVGLVVSGKKGAPVRKLTGCWEFQKFKTCAKSIAN
jgi:hypothetical protein